MLALSFSLLLLATQQAPFAETIEVRIHNIDVIVTDKDDNPVHGLRVEDFELLQDGKPQAITNFAEYAERANTPNAPNDTPALQPPPRKIVFFVDDMNVTPQTRNQLTKSATEMLDATMRDGDEALVVRPSARIDEKIALDFAGDRAAVRDALVKTIESNTKRADVAFAGEWRRFQADIQNADAREMRAIARRHAARVRQRVELRLQTLRAIIATLAPLPGRKFLVTITESMQAMPGREFFHAQKKSETGVTTQGLDTTTEIYAPESFRKIDYVDFTPAIEELARMASSNGITIYALRPEYDIPITADGADSNIQFALENTGETMTLLTGKTGGQSFLGGTRMDDAMRTLARDAGSYYSLAYRGNADFDKPHRVQVRVRNRPELKVRARNEVVRKSPRREMTDRVVAALMTTKLPNELGIGARAAAPAAGKGGMHLVDVDVRVIIGRLAMLREGIVYRGKLTVHYAVSSSDTDFVSGVEPEQVIEIPAADYPTARNKIWGYTLRLNLPKGDHQLAVGMLDGIGQTSGIATLSVNVP